MKINVKKCEKESNVEDTKISVRIFKICSAYIIYKALSRQEKHCRVQTAETDKATPYDELFHLTFM